MQIAAVSMAPKLRDKEHNLSRMQAEIDSEDDLIAFPEICLTGYTIRDEINRLAETIPGTSTDRVLKMAAETNTHIIFGMAEKEGEKFYNTSVLASPDGRIWSYRKTHPVHFGPFEENLYFTPGQKAEVAETKIGKIGMTVCYDLFFPELTKTLALKGADIITNISASPHVTRPFFEKILPARAIESTVYMVYSNTVGVYNNMMFWGGSRIVGPKSRVFAEAKRHKEQTTRAVIDLSELKNAREMRPTLKDTRKEFSFL